MLEFKKDCGAKNTVCTPHIIYGDQLRICLQTPYSIQRSTQNLFLIRLTKDIAAVYMYRCISGLYVTINAIIVRPSKDRVVTYQMNLVLQLCLTCSLVDKMQNNKMSFDKK